MSVKPIPVALVMPCLNEAETLKNTCQSLGFGLGENTDLREQSLVIVDNGSRDESTWIAKEVARSSPAGTVLVVSEETRGHVPARSKGVSAAKHHFGSDFIVQVDADTEYCRDFALSLWVCGKTHGPGTLIEAQMDWPEGFIQQQTALTSLIASVDEQFVTEPNTDVVIDDKGCGYWLCDYESWGGHRREYWSTGEEMLAETTRLFILGKSNGARRALADSVTARHSTRNWNRNAEVELASAGFPMPQSWQKQWKRIGLQALSEVDQHPLEYSASLTMRRKVLTALFHALPRLVQEAVAIQPESKREAELASRIQAHPGPLQPASLIEHSMHIAGVLS